MKYRTTTSNLHRPRQCTCSRDQSPHPLNREVDQQGPMGLPRGAICYEAASGEQHALDEPLERTYAKGKGSQLWLWLRRSWPVPFCPPLKSCTPNKVPSDQPRRLAWRVCNRPDYEKKGQGGCPNPAQIN